MELQIDKVKELPILSRKRVSLTGDVTGATPSRKDIHKAVAKKLGAKEETVIVKHIYPQYGTSKIKVIAHTYDDKAKIAKFEHKSLLKRHESKEAPKTE